MTREVLDARVSAGCELPGCDHGSHAEPEPLWVHARCHPGAGLWADYRNGVLRLTCKQCRKPVLSVLVASRLDKGSDL